MDWGDYEPLIVISPGHGGQDPGAVSGKLVEKTLTWKGCTALTSILMDCYKCRVKLIQPSTEFNSTAMDELIIPPKRASELQADYYFSWHINAGGGTGYESYCKWVDQGTESDRIRQVIHRNLLDGLRPLGLVAHDSSGKLGIKYEDWYELTHVNCWSSLHELAFIDSLDAKILEDPAFTWLAAIFFGRGLSEALSLSRR